MDDLLYVLLGIARVGYSLYSARQKALKKQSGEIPPDIPTESSPLPIPGNTGKGRSILEDIFNEMQGHQPPPEPAPQKVPTPIVSPYQNHYTTSANNLPEEVEKSEIEYAKRLAQMAKKAKNSHENDRQVLKDENFVQNFNLRDAVIFSELLNRKYF
jgi:hypothetical protein